MQQKTLSVPVIFQGIGVHSGKEVSFSLLPAPSDTGIVFRKGGHFVPALASSVLSTHFCTVLGPPSIATVEHLVAALFGLGITNAYVETACEEMPIMDGSSRMFVDTLQKHSLVDQEVKRKTFSVPTSLEVTGQNGSYVRLMPTSHTGLSMNIIVEMRDHLLSQKYQTANIYESFCKEVYDARTYGYFEDKKIMQEKGLALGASLENTLVFKEGRPMNLERYSNECARHKALDALGDLSLTGCYLNAIYEAVNPGHFLNTELAKKCLDLINEKS